MRLAFLLGFAFGYGLVRGIRSRPKAPELFRLSGVF